MINQSTILKFVICGVLLFGIGAVVLNIISYNRRENDFDLTKPNKKIVPPRHHSGISSIEIIDDFKLNTKPPQAAADIPKVSIQTFKVIIGNDTRQNTIVRTAGKGNYHVLLLYGEKFSSKGWEKIGTLQYLSSWGYRAFAIDIPKNGNQTFPITEDKEAVQWLTKLLHTLRLSNVVIVSPSRSGKLSLPYIFQLNEQQQLIRGYVPIDPIGASHYHADDFKQIKIPTLIVHAEKDSRFQFTLDILKQIPTKEILIIKDATYAAYYEKPLVFHNALRQFLYNVYRPIYKKSLLSNTTKLITNNNK